MTLTDRYITATTAKVSEDQRDDVAAELREAIGDSIDAAMDSDPSMQPDQAERDVLNAMGDPEKLAAAYANRTLTLIGPDLYLKWKRLTVLLLWIILPLMAVIFPIAGWLDGDSWGAIIGSTVGGTISVGVHLVFWVTLVFAILERTGVGAKDLSEPWSVDDLKEAPNAEIPASDTIGSIVTLVVTAIFIVWQQLYPWASNAAGEGLPLLTPSLWNFILPALLVVMAIELVVVIARHVRGQWTTADAWLTLGLNVSTIILVAIPVAQHTLLNRELFTEIGWPDAATTVTLDQVEWITLLVVIIVGIIDVVVGFRKAHRAAAVRN